MTARPLQTPAVSQLTKGGGGNWCLSTLLNYIPRSSFTALLPVNSTYTKAANCCLHNLQPFNSTNPHIGLHAGRGAGEEHFSSRSLSLYVCVSNSPSIVLVWSTFSLPLFLQLTSMRRRQRTDNFTLRTGQSHALPKMLETA